jgi:hypothetical protein
MSMDHRQAQSTNAVERYLLGEMNEPERFEFESHYFECEECAGDVRAVHALAKGVRVVCAEEPVPVREHTLSSVSSARAAPRSGWFGWLSPALAAAFCILAAYQGFIVIPGLRWLTASRAMAPVVLRAAARGDEQVVEIRRDQPVTLMSLDVNGVEPGAALRYEIVGPAGARITNVTAAPPAGSPLIVYFTNTDIKQSGPWTLWLRDSKGMEISRYPFVAQIR